MANQAYSVVAYFVEISFGDILTATVLAPCIISILEWSFFAKSDPDSIMSSKIIEKTGKLTLFKKVCHTQHDSKKG